MESKYYAPNISEFYSGFEFEQIEIVGKSGYSEEDWVKNICTPGFGAVDEDIDNLDDDYIRVKYLDKSDIESLGFRASTTENHLYYLGDVSLQLHVNGELTISYYNEFNEGWRTAVEQIIIKNKSELIKLLKQLNVVDEEEKKS